MNEMKRRVEHAERLDQADMQRPPKQQADLCWHLTAIDAVILDEMANQRGWHGDRWLITANL